MAIEIISGEQARESLQSNPSARWPSRQVGDRLYPLATPIAAPRFTIQPEDRVFCIGSCFAREIGEALTRLDFNVLSLFDDLPKSVYRKRRDVTMFNKYNVASIYNELYWAFHPETYCHDQVLIETSSGQLQDYQLTGAGYTDESVAVKRFREVFNQAFQQIKQADLVVLTLGLSEVWFDKQTGLYLNMAVSKALLKRYPDRFQLHVFDYEQTLSFLDDIYRLLDANLKPNFRVLITVSPIPLNATFRQQDVLLANAYSKAVLRSAVERFVSDKSNVNYFPSYEFVTLSNPTLVWREDDYRHVDRSFIDYIMSNVMMQFMTSTPELVEANALAKARSLYQCNFLAEATAVLAPLIQAKDIKPSRELRILWAAIRLRVHGKYKTLLLDGLIHLRKRAENTPLQLFFELINRFRKLSASTYVGYAEHWDGEYLTGWACCLRKIESIKVKVIVNKRVIMTVKADLPRDDVAAIRGSDHLRCGFRIPLSKEKVANHAVKIVFADNGLELGNSPLRLSDATVSQFGSG